MSMGLERETDVAGHFRRKTLASWSIDRSVGRSVGRTVGRSVDGFEALRYVDWPRAACAAGVCLRPGRVQCPVHALAAVR